MAEVDVSTVGIAASARCGEPPTRARLNVADRLAESAARSPDGLAVVCPLRPGGYATITFGELDAAATRIARGLVDWGVQPGTRLALLVPAGIKFVTLVFALLRSGAAIVLVDPGLGRRNLVRSLSEAGPEGFIAVSVAQAARLCLRYKFPRAKWNVTVGRRWCWGGPSLAEVHQRGAKSPSVALPKTQADDAAAIIFTSGSTGKPKGVLYTQRMFDTQVAEIQSVYGIEPGGVDLSCFPLFALFNSAMGVTTVLPDMNFSRPASADPRKLLAAANDWKVTQAFASPTVWRKLSDHCGKSGERIETLREIFSCGATVPADVLRSTLAFAAPNAKMHTPYGATECLPVATIEAAEVLGETAARTDAGAGICVGRKFESIEWRVIRITDGPIETMEDADVLPIGEIGELVVRGPQASPQYVTRTEYNAAAKIAGDAERAGQSCAPIGVEDDLARYSSIEAFNWHRMGDVGYLDAHGRFWYCGRKSQRIETVGGSLFTECVEAIVNTFPGVRRSALVGVGAAGAKTPILVIEPDANGLPPDAIDVWQRLARGHQGFPPIDRFLIHSKLPVDVRHNAKINREQLAAWAATRLPELA